MIVGEQIVAQVGYVLAVRIKEDKSTYNSVEDLAGRMVTLRAGDVLAGTLGTRRALRGYAGVVPAPGAKRVGAWHGGRRRWPLPQHSGRNRHQAHR